MYQRVKVPEYWIVAPDEKTIDVYVRQENESYLRSVRNCKYLSPTIISDVSIDLAKIGEDLLLLFLKYSARKVNALGKNVAGQRLFSLVIE